jgi:hypothetical protein
VHVLAAAYPIARKILFSLDAETAHHASMAGLRFAEKTGLLKALSDPLPHGEPIELMGLKFPNRIGLAAGLDKEGNTIDALGRLGFGFIEIGTITPRPQAGNPKPRLFRLIPHEAIINRMGFNNPGIDAGVANVRAHRSFTGPIGFNIGKNTNGSNAVTAIGTASLSHQASIQNNITSSDRTGDAFSLSCAKANISRAIKGGNTMLMLRNRLFVSVIRLEMIPIKLENKNINLFGTSIAAN